MTERGNDGLLTSVERPMDISGQGDIHKSIVTGPSYEKKQKFVYNNFKRTLAALVSLLQLYLLCTDITNS